MKLRAAIVLGFAAIMGSGLIAAGAATAGPSAPPGVQTSENGCPIVPRGSDGKPLPPPKGPDGRPLPPPSDNDGNPCPPPS